MTRPEDTPPVNATPGEPPPKTAPTPGAFDREASETMRRVKNWILFGSDQLPRGASLEFAIASQWLLRIGVTILVLGIGFFVKYSIDQDWISREARVLAAAAGGMAMLVGGSRVLGGRYSILGQGLMAAGVTTLYFCVHAARAFYGLIDEGTAFFIMALITALSGFIAVRFGAATMAVLAVLGGYAAPLMFQSAGGLAPVLSYMLVIAIGVLGITTLRDWPLVKALAFACHILLFHASVLRDADMADLGTALPFLGAYFLVFSTMPFLHNLRRGDRSGVVELLALHINAAYFSLMGWHLMTRLGYDHFSMGTCSMALAFFYAGHAFAYLRLRVNDRPMLVSFIALSAGYLGMTMPLCLSGLWLSTAWAFQAVAMAWMARQLGSGLLRQLSYLLILVLVGRYACVDLPRRAFMPVQWDHHFVWPLLAGLATRLLSYGLPLAGMMAAGLLLGKDGRKQPALIPADNDIPDQLNRGTVRGLIGIVGALLGMAYLVLEISQTVRAGCPEFYMTTLTLAGIAFTLLVLRWGELWIGTATTRAVSLALAIILGFKLLFLDLGGQLGTSHDYLLYQAWSPMGVISRLVDFSAFIGFLAILGRLLARGGSKDAPALIAAVSLSLALLILTTETVNFVHALAMDAFRPGAVSILWTLFGLGLLVWGIRCRDRWSRYAGLGLFTVVTFKVFLFDLSGAETLYRVGAFMALGVLLLSGSFLYLRNQKAITGETIGIGGMDQ